MVSGGEFKNSLVQQMVWGGTRNSGNIMSGLRACPEEEQEESTKMHPLSSPSLLFTHDHPLVHISGQVPEVDSTATSPTGLHGGQEEGQIPESWSQMLIGGLVGDHERYSTATALLSKGLEKGPMAQAYDFYGHGEEIQASGAMSQLGQMLLASSPRSSCITASLGGSMPDFSNGVAPASATEPELRDQLSDHSSESNNNTSTGSAPKKARVQAASSGQSILKVRKERLGDRITALHQIVSPFGKTDTASVLQETIGYIGFLMGQIEALTYPYMGHAGTGSSAHQQTNAQDGEEGKKYLRSRGLCLVPVSCTSHLAAGSASDFWPVAPLAGIILR